MALYSSIASALFIVSGIQNVHGRVTSTGHRP
jgi:hypothetical protein